MPVGIIARRAERNVGGIFLLIRQKKMLEGKISKTEYDSHLVSPPWCRDKRWPCNPRVSGSIPCAGNLKKLLIWMKIHELTQNHKAFVQMAKRIE